MKNVLIINGHPDKESFCYQLAMSYKNGAEQAGASCTVVNLIDLQFDPILRYGYRKRTELEPDLIRMQELVRLANHMVFVYPTWWASYPALLKGFFDRTFLPGFAFKYRENSLLWDKLLSGKTAHIISTMDTPKWYNCMVYRDAANRSVKKGILEFCGIKPVRITTFGPIKSASETKRAKWIGCVEQLGRNVS